MKNKHLWMVVFTAILCFLLLPSMALAGGGEEPETAPVVEETPEPTPEPTPVPTPMPTPEPEYEPIPFTPEGTGTTMDNATDADGKEFYTISTEDGNVFYLIIDNQRTDNNVYFLNAVTENDLMPLAVPSDDSESSIPEPQPVVTPVPGVVEDDDLEPDEPEEPEPGKKKGGSWAFLLLIMVAVGGGGYYLKIYKPKHQAQDDDDDEFGDDDYGGDYPSNGGGDHYIDDDELPDFDNPDDYENPEPDEDECLE